MDVSKGARRSFRGPDGTIAQGDPRIEKFLSAWWIAAREARAPGEEKRKSRWTKVRLRSPVPNHGRFIATADKTTTITFAESVKDRHRAGAAPTSSREGIGDWGLFSRRINQ